MASAGSRLTMPRPFFSAKGDMAQEFEKLLALLDEPTRALVASLPTADAERRDAILNAFDPKTREALKFMLSTLQQGQSPR